jgi:hypothetical protein
MAARLAQRVDLVDSFTRPLLRGSMLIKQAVYQLQVVIARRMDHPTNGLLQRVVPSDFSYEDGDVLDAPKHNRRLRIQGGLSDCRCGWCGGPTGLEESHDSNLSRTRGRGSDW